MSIECLYQLDCNHKDCDKEFCERQYRLNNLYTKSLLTEVQRRHITLDLSTEQVDLEAYQYLANIARNIENFVGMGSNLFIYSLTCGNGKTSWAVKLMEAYFKSIWAKVDLSCHALFISVPRFLLALKANISERNEYAEQVLSRVQDADLVIWDDIAAKTGTEFEINHLLSIIDNRIAAGKSNIYTSNLTPTGLVAAMGERLASRVANLSTVIQFKGTDKRGLSF